MGTLRGPGRRRRRRRGLHAMNRCPPREPRFRVSVGFAILPAPPVVIATPPLQVRQNYHPQCESAVNSHINLEFYASYVYLSMAYYFIRENVALKQMAEYFKQLSRNGRELAEKLMQMQNLRGGRIRLRDIRKPDYDNWQSALKALKYALNVGKSVNQSLLDLHQLATSKNDAHLCYFLQRHYLDKQVNTIKELADHITNLRASCEPCISEYLLDNLTLGNSNNA